jgi:hypothetical protein
MTKIKTRKGVIRTIKKIPVGALSETQATAIKKIIEDKFVGVSSFLYDPSRILNYIKILEKLHIPKKGVLELGPGAGYLIYAGKLLGLNICGVDIDNFGTKYGAYSAIHNVLGITDSIILYGGDQFPYKDNSFKVLFSDYSINSGYMTGISIKRKLLRNRLRELIRISKKRAVWYVGGELEYDLCVSYFAAREKTKGIKIKELVGGASYTDDLYKKRLKERKG